MDHDDQELVASILRSMPPPAVRGDFVARVNARIDETAGWLGLADFRLWTLRLAPAAAALVLVAVLWSGRASSAGGRAAAPAASSSAATFSPASPADWQKDVTGNDMLDAALSPPGGSHVR
jgi:hypothetical protein